MCTVTYIPCAEGFYLTSNRDEHVKRGHAIPPRLYMEGTHALLYPKDTDKYGSWVTVKDNGDMAVLLNGAFVKHIAKQSYIKSRGLVVMDVINDENPDLYFQSAALDGIAPFTLVLYSKSRLYECRWDGSNKHFLPLNKQTPYIWSSATLYDEQAAAKRKIWFASWLASHRPKTTENILHFHNHGGSEDKHDGLVINRDGKMKTVSITNIHAKQSAITMTYRDLTANQQYVSEIPQTVSGLKSKRLKFNSPRWLAVRSFFIRVFNWEYWPFNFVYAPIMFYWFWLSLKSRSFFFFNTANPLIENGGFAMESKALIHKMLPKEYCPQTLSFKTGSAIDLIDDAIAAYNLSFPLIAKPDIGGRGILVKLVNNRAELAAYIKSVRVDFLVQEYVPYKNEVGIFYYRTPGEQTGKISGIVGKEFLKLTGDGKSTVKELIVKEARYLLQLPVLAATHGEFLETILAKGQVHTLVPYGNHARGAKFIDLSHLITEKLTETIDTVCRQIPEFYFGRMDVMYNNWDDLCAGKNFSIVEVNGAGSEPTHIYDPAHSIFFAWKEIIRHWKILYKISKINKRDKGLTTMSYHDGIAMLKANTAYLKLVS